MDNNISDLEDLADELDSLIEKSNALNGNHVVPFEELFSSEFMKNHTDFNSFKEFCSKSGLDWSNCSSISDDVLDAFVSEKTDFTNFQDMIDDASQYWSLNQLGF